MFAFNVLLVYIHLLAIFECEAIPPQIYSKSWLEKAGSQQLFDDCSEEKSASQCLEQRTKDFIKESLTSPAMNIYRLPTTIRPQSYKLKLLPNLDEEFKFYGEVEIYVHVLENTNAVFLHSYNLEIRDLAVYHGYDKVETSFQTDSVNQLLKIYTFLPLLKDEFYEIKVQFDGILAQEYIGFYRSSYTIGNETSWIATTQFEATYARMAFPCFDEPQFRATFEVKLARHLNEIALSNMPLGSVSPPDQSINNRVWCTFLRTPAMPTYLLAFVVGKLKHLVDGSKKFRTWVKGDSVGEARFVHGITPELTKALEDYTGIQYNLPKLDLVAMPNFFQGAMENWGLMIFRQENILSNDDEDELKKEEILRITTHELAHQWFGNYVTMQWWNILWLKEGLATLLEFTIGGVIAPAWRMEELFVHKSMSKALDTDGITENKSMTYAVNTPTEISSQINVISYEKAASVLRMLSHIISQNSFKAALNLYLRTGIKSGGVATPVNLWDAFDEQLTKENRTLGNGFTIAETMRTWTDQAGYPLVTVSRYKRGSRADIILKQEPYRPSFAKVEITSQEWIIPITCGKGSHSEFGTQTQSNLWLINKTELVLANETKNDEGFICNIQGTGYYRVNYDHDGWMLIIEFLNTSPDKIQPLNRHQIINDVFHLSMAEIIPFRTAFEVVRYIDYENDIIPWKAALSNMHTLITLFEGTKAYEKLKNFFKDRLKNIYKEIGFYEQSTDDHTTKIFRSNLLPIVCQLGYSDCLLKAATEFEKINDIDSIPPYLRETLLCAAFKGNTSVAAWEKLWNLYDKSADLIKKKSIIHAFGCAEDETILKKNLLDITEGRFRSGVKAASIQSILKHNSGMEAALNFVQEILPNMSDYPNGEKIIVHIISKIPEYLKTSEQLNLLDQILNKTAELDARAYFNVKKSLEQVKRVAEKNTRFYENKSSLILTGISSMLSTFERYSSNYSTASPQPSSASINLPTCWPLIRSIFSAISIFILASS